LAARFPRPGFVDGESAPGQGRAIQTGNRVLCRAAVWHLDEAKTPRAAGVAVGHNPDRVDRPIRLEELAEVLLRGGKSQGAHKNLHVCGPQGSGCLWSQDTSHRLPTLYSHRQTARDGPELGGVSHGEASLPARLLIPLAPVPALPRFPGARRSSPWHDRGPQPWRARCGPVLAGRLCYTADRGSGGRGPG